MVLVCRIGDSICFGCRGSMLSLIFFACYVDRSLCYHHISDFHNMLYANSRHLSNKIMKQQTAVGTVRCLGECVVLLKDIFTAQMWSVSCMDVTCIKWYMSECASNIIAPFRCDRWELNGLQHNNTGQLETK